MKRQCSWQLLAEIWERRAQMRPLDVEKAKINAVQGRVYVEADLTLCGTDMAFDLIKSRVAFNVHNCIMITHRA